MLVHFALERRNALFEEQESHKFDVGCSHVHDLSSAVRVDEVLLGGTGLFSHFHDMLEHNGDFDFKSQFDVLDIQKVLMVSCGALERYQLVKLVEVSEHTRSLLFFLNNSACKLD